MKDWDFGYFGKEIDGYVHYNTDIQSQFSEKFQAFRSKTGGAKAAQYASQGRGKLAAEPGRTGRAVHDHCDPSWCFVALAITEQKGNQDANDFD